MSSMRINSVQEKWPYSPWQTKWCSLAHTVRFPRLACGRKQLTQGPDVIRHACSHRWRALLPSGTHRTGTCALSQRPRRSHAPVRSGNVGEGLADHPDPWAPLRTVGPAGAGRVRLTSVLTLATGSPLGELPLGHRPLPQPVVVAHCGLRGRLTAPGPPDASVTPRPPRIPASSPRPRSIVRASMPLSAAVRRSQKTGARVSAQGVAHVRQRQRRRVPLGVRAGARVRSPAACV